MSLQVWVVPLAFILYFSSIAVSRKCEWDTKSCALAPMWAYNLRTVMHRTVNFFFGDCYNIKVLVRQKPANSNKVFLWNKASITYFSFCNLSRETAPIHVLRFTVGKSFACIHVNRPEVVKCLENLEKYGHFSKLQTCVFLKKCECFCCHNPDSTFTGWLYMY